MASIYSVRFVAVHNISPLDTADYTFPDGDYTFVLRDMDAFFPGVGGGAVTVHDSYGCTIWAVTEASAGNGTWEQWAGRQVYAPGDQLYCSGTTVGSIDGIDWSASGYALSGLVPFPPAT